MKVLYAASEAVPFCKTGGLADVAGSLPPALAAEGVETAVILPLYESVKQRYGAELQYLCYDYVDLAWRHSYCGLFALERQGVTWYFLDNEQYFRRPGLYGYPDDGERFGFFSRAVVKMLDHLKFWPDVIHCNDWQTALIPIYLKDDGVREERYRSIRTVLSIHNIEYQGRYGRETLGDLFGLDAGWATDGTILMDGDVNLLKGAILCADAVNAVSPTYAEELKNAAFAHGLDPILRSCGHKLRGILNGIDTDYYNPATDPVLAQKYDLTTFPEGKTANKLALQRELGLPERADVPMLAVISRLAAHKGVDLISTIGERLMREQDVQFVILGKGEPQYEEFFRWLERTFPDRVRALIAYDRDLSRRIYAAADLFLMPSRSEPCGLSQMIASRYGAVPVVRETGGLYDSIKGYWIRDGEVMGNGFTFSDYSADQLMERTCAALALYRDRDAFDALVKKIMQIDFSWQVSAMQYLRMYDALTGGAE